MELHTRATHARASKRSNAAIESFFTVRFTMPMAVACCCCRVSPVPLYYSPHVFSSFGRNSWGSRCRSTNERRPALFNSLGRMWTRHALRGFVYSRKESAVLTCVQTPFTEALPPPVVGVLRYSMLFSTGGSDCARKIRAFTRYAASVICLPLSFLVSLYAAGVVLTQGIIPKELQYSILGKNNRKTDS